MKDLLKEMANEYNYIGKEELVMRLYIRLGLSHEVAILNDKYLIVDGKQYHFRFNSKDGSYTVKEF